MYFLWYQISVGFLLLLLFEELMEANVNVLITVPIIPKVFYIVF